MSFISEVNIAAPLCKKHGNIANGVVKYDCYPPSTCNDGRIRCDGDYSFASVEGDDDDDGGGYDYAPAA